MNSTAAIRGQSLSSGARHYMLSVLLIVYTFNFIDRQILSILLEAIKLDLGLSDQALGFLVGFAFAAFYAVLGVPIALWADSHNRRNLIALALTIWSAMTALCGLAQNFVQLAMARVGVGIGEAGCSPPAHSMISDCYSPENRATALGIYSLGIPFGIMFGMFAGGWINEIFGWRYAFFVVGLPGVLLALVVRFTIREPARGLSENRVAEANRPTISQTLHFLQKRRSFLHLAFGAALASFVGYGVINWFPAFLIRSHGMGTGEIGTWLGLILGVPGGAGILLGGYLADRLGKRDPGWRLWFLSIATLVAMPFGVVVYFMNDPHHALLLFSIPVCLNNFYLATTFAQTQNLVGLRMRSAAAALLLLIINLIGLGTGPWAIGALSDLLAPRFGADSLRWSLMIFAFLGFWVALHFYYAGRHLEGDLARAEDGE